MLILRKKSKSTQLVKTSSEVFRGVLVVNVVLPFPAWESNFQIQNGSNHHFFPSVLPLLKERAEEF